MASEEPSAPFSLESDQWSREELGGGVHLFQGFFREDFKRPQFISVLRVDLDAPGVKVRFRAAHPDREGRSTVPDLAASTNAIAGTNGGFGHSGREFANMGILKVNGEVYRFIREEHRELPFVGRGAVGIDENEQWHFTTRPGSAWPDDWPEVRHALAGGYRLIENGRINEKLSTHHSFREQRHVESPQPRTALGFTAERDLLLVTVDGRHSGRAEGMTLHELAELLHKLGCVEALNLEGGGSTTMWARPRGVVNHPSDNAVFDRYGERRLRSAVLVFADHADPDEIPAGFKPRRGAAFGRYGPGRERDRSHRGSPASALGSQESVPQQRVKK